MNRPHALPEQQPSARSPVPAWTDAGHEGRGRGMWRSGLDGAYLGSSMTSLDAGLPSDSDEALVAKANGGNSAAFDVLVTRYQAKVYALAVRMGAASDCEDVLQETFLRVFRKLDTFRGESRFSTWLYRIAVNQVLLQRRSSAQRRRVESLEEHLPRFDDAGRLAPWAADYGRAARAEDLLERKELAEKLREAVERLPDEYRLPVVLHDLQGLAGAEAAAVLDLEPATFRTRLHRARLMLRGYLGHLAGGEA